MNARDRSYWVEEAKSRELRNARRADNITFELLSLYDDAATRIAKEIHAIFGKYARDNSLTDAEASRLITGEEYNVWRKSIEDYMAAAAQGGAEGSKTLLELNTLAAKSRISRKEQMLSSIYRHMIDLAQDSNMTLQKLLGKQLTENYYESCFTIQRGIGYGYGVPRLSEQTVRDILTYPWAKKTFSDSVWDDVDTLSSVVRREIALGFTSGAGVDKMAKAIDDVMGKGRYNAERLARTEAKYFANQGELMGYRQTGIKRYRVLGGSEGSGNCTCAGLNGQEFDIEDATPGVNCPPIHPNCLCTVVAAFERSIFDVPPDAQPLKHNPEFEAWKKRYAAGESRGKITYRTDDLHAIPITDAAIERVPLVQLPGMSDEQAIKLQQRHRELLRFVQAEPAGREAIAYCDAKTLQLLDRYTGGDNKVQGTIFAQPHVAMHNHPSGGTFTHTDLVSFVRVPSMQVLTAVGNNGALYTLTKSQGYNDYQFARCLQDTYPRLKEAVQRQDIRQYQQIMDDLLTREVQAYGVKYTAQTVP